MEHLPMFEVLNFGVRGVVIVMLLHPPDCLWRIVFDGCIDKHVAASFFIPFTSFSPELFLKELPETQAACHTKWHRGNLLFRAGDNVSQQHQTHLLYDSLCKVYYI